MASRLAEAVSIPRTRASSARRDQTRAALAFALLGLLAVEIVAALWVNAYYLFGAGEETGKLALGPGQTGFSLLVNSILGPTVALVGAATGFYCGTRNPTPPGLANTSVPHQANIPPATLP